MHSADLTRARRACTRIASTVLPPPVAPTVGTIALLPHQRSAASQVLAILARHGVALLADDVGLGKTYAALAVAAHYDHVEIIAPATLLPMWRTAIAATGATPSALISLHRFSHHELDVPPASDGRRLVIIDEAHHLRTRSTRRYRAIAQHVIGAHVLLVSATPLHNRRTDPSALFALTLGEHTPRIGPALAPLIVRHTHQDAARGAATTLGAHPGPTTQPALHRPAVRHHAPVRLTMHRPILDAILALPAPLPAHDGAAAGALIRLGLLRAWCSSDAALASAVRRRRLRGAALEDALRAGRHPTNAELRTWVVGEFDGQLAFPELLTDHATDGAPLLERLTRHLDALADLAQLHERLHARREDTDHQRVAWLRALKTQHPHTPILAFSQFTRTVDALQRALRDIAGVASLTGTHARIASGVIPRHDALARFAPRAQERPPPPPHQAITLLLTTDLLAEGVNLQDAGIVVHLDLPWTAALRDQRIGRCVRVGSPHREVHVHRLAPPADIERIVAFARRVAHKARLAHRLLHGDPLTARTQFLRVMTRWQHRDWVPPGERTQRLHGSPGDHAALVLLCSGEHVVLLALRGTPWRVCHSDVSRASVAASIDRAMRTRTAERATRPMAPRARGLHTTLPPDARRAVRRWLRRQHARATMRTSEDAATHSAVRRRLLAHIGAGIERLDTPLRYRHATTADAARHCVSQARGAAAHAALTEWEVRARDLATGTSAAFLEWLDGWRTHPALAPPLSAPVVPAHSTQSPWRIRSAVVLTVP